MAHRSSTGRARSAIKTRLGTQVLQPGDLRVREEERYIRRLAARREGRFVSIGKLILFSTTTGDAWLLDCSDHLAVCVARDGVAEPVRILETDTVFVIQWKGSYHIDGASFVYADRQSGRVVTVSGYPTAQIAELS